MGVAGTECSLRWLKLIGHMKLLAQTKLLKPLILIPTLLEAMPI